MANIELAAAYISIVPSLRGAGRQIQSELSGIDMTVPGSSMGKSLSGAMVKGLDFQAVGARLQAVGDRIADVGGQLTRKITLPALAAASAVAGIFAVSGWKRLVALDTARAQFQGLGYDAEAVMKQVDAGVTDTSLSMAQGASAAVGILATGAIPLEQLESQIKRIANVSAAYNVDSEQAAYLLNNVLTKQKVTWGDLSQMQQNQIPVVTALADHFGVAGDAIMEMAQNGEIAIDDLNAALDTKAGAAAEAYASSWAGITANIRANIGKVGAAFLESLFPQIKGLAEQMLTALRSDEFKTRAAEWGQAVGEFFTRMVERVKTLIDWWNELSPGVQKFIGTLAGVAVAAGPFLLIVGKITTLIGGLVGGIGTAIGVVGKIAPAFGGVAGAAGAASGGIGGLAAGFLKFAGPIGIAVSALIAMWTQSETFRESIINLAQKLMEVGQKIWTALAPVLAKVGELIGKVAGTIGDVLGKIIEKVAPLLGRVADLVVGVIDAIMPLVEIIIDMLGPALDGLLVIVEAVFDAIIPIIDAALNIITGMLEFWIALFTGDWEGVWKSAQKVAQGVWDFIVGIVKGAIGIITTIVDGWVGAITGAWEWLSNAANNIWNGIQSFLIGIVGNIVSGMTSGFDNLRNFLGNLWSRVSQGVQTAWDGIVNFFASIPDRIMGFFSGVGQWLYNAGKSLLQGFINGIRDMIGGIGDVIGGAMDFARGFFPSSPAKRGPFSGAGWRQLLQSGAAVGEQWADGVLSSRSTVGRALDTVMRGSLPSGAAGGASGAAIYVQNPFTGEYLLAQVDHRADGRVAAAGSARTVALAGGRWADA